MKAYRPVTNSIGSGQVLQYPYPSGKAKLIVQEMADLLALDLVDKGLVTDQLVLIVGYDIDNLKDPEHSKAYHGPITTDSYGRHVPKHAHGTANLPKYTSSTRQILDSVSELFDRIVDTKLLVRRVSITAAHVVPEASAPKSAPFEQLDLFTDYKAVELEQAAEGAELERER